MKDFVPRRRSPPPPPRNAPPPRETATPIRPPFSGTRRLHPAPLPAVVRGTLEECPESLVLAGECSLETIVNLGYRLTQQHLLAGVGQECALESVDNDLPEIVDRQVERPA